jgi:hypothetical protein
MANLEKETSPDMPDFTFHLLRRDYEELVAEGVLPDTPEAAEDFIDGYLSFEGRCKQRRK